MTSDSDPGKTDESRRGERPPAGTLIEARIVRYDHGPDVLTLYSGDPSGGKKATAWISADEGSFLDLQEYR
ncbi:MAG: hypothetical protein V5A24_04730 [Haloarculaceae archaeon]